MCSFGAAHSRRVECTVTEIPRHSRGDITRYTQPNGLAAEASAAPAADRRSYFGAVEASGVGGGVVAGGGAGGFTG